MNDCVETLNSNDRWLWKNIILFGKYSFPPPLSQMTYTYFMTDDRLGHMIFFVFMGVAYASLSLGETGPGLGHITHLIQCM